LAILGTHQSGNILIPGIMNIITIHHPALWRQGGNWNLISQLIKRLQARHGLEERTGGSSKPLQSKFSHFPQQPESCPTQ